MALVGQQYTLLGLLDEELVVELQVPRELVDQMAPTDVFAQAVMKHIGWATKYKPDRWLIESQALHSR